MWVLSAAGHLLNGKRLWLRPGKTYLFGRVKGDGVVALVDNPTVSRRHLTLAISSVKPGYSSRVHRRTKVTVSDLATKCGTRIDDMRIKGQDLELSGDGPFKIFIGRCPEAFTLEWVDAVLSIDRSILERQGAAHEEGNGGGRNATSNEAYLLLRGKLEPLDIKLVTEYLPNRTTHVVQATRDSHQWTLEALLGAKYIVDASFVDAITYATTPASVDDPHSHCPLEDDYDGNWPDAMGHVPARDGRGDAADDGRAFAPDPSRGEVFEGYTFVVTSSEQMMLLLPVVSGGQGKVVTFDMKAGKSTPFEIYEFMQSIAGQKESGVWLGRDSRVGLVELEVEGEHEDWARRVEKQVEVLSGVKVVRTDWFRDAVVRNTAGVLFQEAEAERVEETPEPEPEPEPAFEPAPEPGPVNESAQHMDVEDTASRVTRSSGAKRRREESRPARQTRRDEEPSTVRDSVSPPAPVHRPPPAAAALMAEESQPRSATEDSQSSRPYKRPRVREFRSRARTFELDDELELMDDVGAAEPAQEGDREQVVPDSQASEAEIDVQGGEVGASGGVGGGGGATTTGEGQTSVLDEGVSSLLPGARAMRTHAVNLNQSQASRGRDDGDANAESEQELAEETTRPRTRRGKRTREKTATAREKGTETEHEREGGGTPRRSKRQKMDTVLEAARQRRKEADRAFEERERAQSAEVRAGTVEGGGGDGTEADDLGIPEEELRNLVIVEEMPVRERRPEEVSNRDGRWDDRWNGRKNFKRFRRSRRRGVPGGDEEENGESFRGGSAPEKVPLEEVRRGTWGLGEVYWEEERVGRPRETGSRSRGGSARVSAAGGRGQGLIEGEPAEEKDHEEEAEEEDEGENSSRRAQSHAPSRGDRQGRSTPMSAPPPSRRTRIGRILQEEQNGENEDEDEDEDEDAGFRWRRRR